MKKETNYFETLQLIRQLIPQEALEQNLVSQDELNCDRLFVMAHKNLKRDTFDFQGRKLTHDEAAALLDKLTREGLEQNYDALAALDERLRIEEAKLRIMEDAGHREEYLQGAAVDDPELARKMERAIAEVKSCKRDLAARLAYRNSVIAKSDPHLQSFLVLWDMRRYAEENGFQISPSTTSLGDLTACCLGITQWKDCSIRDYDNSDLVLFYDMMMIASGAAFRALYRYLQATYPDSFYWEKYLLHEDFVGLDIWATGDEDDLDGEDDPDGEDDLDGEVSYDTEWPF